MSMHPDSAWASHSAANSALRHDSWKCHLCTGHMSDHCKLPCFCTGNTSVMWWHWSQMSAPRTCITHKG